MKKSFWIPLVAIAITFQSCKEKPVPPVLSTNEVTEISINSGVSGGIITDDGGASILSRGICWDTSEEPTIENTITSESVQLTSFISNLSQLNPKTTYFVRAYATNEAGTGYGNSVSFTTLGDKPVSNGHNTTNIQLNSVTLNSLVNPNFLITTTAFEWGTTLDYGNTVTCTQSPVSGNSPVNVTADLSGLTPGTTYHFRLKAENSLGVTYGSDMTFRTLGDIPTATISEASNILVGASTLNGAVNANYLSSVTTFEWGTTVNYGNTITCTQSPVIGSNPVNVSAELSGLAPGTTYHYRVKAENSLGIAYSGDKTFRTLGNIPSATISEADNIQVRASSLEGKVNPNYLSSTVVFEWGTTTSFGNSVTAVQSPITGNEQINVSANISGLLPGTTYFARIKAENSLGTSYSGNISFTTKEIEWIKASDFPGEARCSPLAFTYNGKGYYGLGSNSVTGENLTDFWTFDPVNSAWTRLNDCPFKFINGLTSMSLVGSTLYVFKEWALYSYNVNSDTWEFLCNTTTSLFAVSGFSINERPFFFIKSSSELFEYFPEDKTLRKKGAIINNYADWALNEIFVINNEAFLIHKNDAKVEIYHYLLQSDTWEKKLEKEFSNWAFTSASFIITIDNCAFIGQSTSFMLSALDDNATVTPQMPSSAVWKYDPMKNEFKQCVNLPGEFRARSGCFSFENSGYVIGGATVDPITSKFKYLKDVWIMKR